MVEERLQNHRRIVNERKRIEEQEDKDKDEIISIQVAARNRMDCLMKKKKKEASVKNGIINSLKFCEHLQLFC